MPLLTNIPLSLYVHIPWCVRKCPYCDFNSHAVKEGIPEKIYVDALLQDLEENLSRLDGRPLGTIFFGGGTPSLFSAQAIEAILSGIQTKLPLTSDIEITLEANPGTLEQARFKDYRSIGVNRLSIGIQSLDNIQLQKLGRIHDREAAIRAVKTAQDSGFDNLNIDLMYGLPQQSITAALQDLEQALELKAPHFSWYQLTLEPNTAFYHTQPPLPTEDAIWEMQTQGQGVLTSQGLKQYEVSAYSHLQHECRHNLNYWQFGDYLGIGAGAHSKITDLQQQKIQRHWQVKNPRDYLDSHKKKTAQTIEVGSQDAIFEFMLNALRLTEGVPLRLFEERTGIATANIKPLLQIAHDKKLLIDEDLMLKPSELGKRFLNNLVSLFLPE